MIPTGDVVLGSSIMGFIVILMAWTYTTKSGRKITIEEAKKENELRRVIANLDQDLEVYEDSFPDEIDPVHYKDLVIEEHQQRIDGEVGYLLGYRDKPEVKKALKRVVDDLTEYPFAGPNIDKLRNLAKKGEFSEE